MTLQTLQPALDTSIATKTATSVLHRVFTEIKELAHTTEYSAEWIEDSMNILRFSADIEVGFAHSKATMLAVFKNAWNSLPLGFRKQFNLDFIYFAKLQTGGKALSSINNRVATATLWILEEFGKGKRVSIKQRTAEGKPVLNEHGKEIWQEVEFCPYNIDISKLEILNTRARNNAMTDKLWEMLADPFYTCDDVRAEHHKNDDKGNPQYTLRYGLSGPFLIVYQNGNSVNIGELNWEEYENDPLVREAINQILKILNIEMDEDKIFRMIREGWK